MTVPAVVEQREMSHAEEHTYAENIRNAVMRQDGDRWQDWDTIGNQWQDQPLTLEIDRANRHRDREVQRMAFPAGVTKAKARLQERGESSTVEV